jgi:hypothetical protein
VNPGRRGDVRRSLHRRTEPASEGLIPVGRGGVILGGPPGARTKDARMAGSRGSHPPAPLPAGALRCVTEGKRSLTSRWTRSRADRGGRSASRPSVGRGDDPLRSCQNGPDRGGRSVFPLRAVLIGRTGNMGRSSRLFRCFLLLVSPWSANGHRTLPKKVAPDGFPVALERF